MSAYSAEEILGKENFELLNQNGKIQSNEFKPKEAKFSLLPDTELSNKIAEELASNEGELPSLIGENIYLIPKENIDLNEASVILRSVSKMEGMQYYSNGEKTGLHFIMTHIALQVRKIELELMIKQKEAQTDLFSIAF